MLNQSLLDKIEKLTAEEATIEGTTFYFGKIGAVKAWPIFLRVRAQISQILQLGRITINVNDDQTLSSLVSVIIALPPEHLQALQDDLFPYVQFKNKHTNNSRQDVKETEDMAFDGLEPVDIGEVLARSLAVNFFKSMQRIGSWASHLEKESTSP